MIIGEYSSFQLKIIAARCIWALLVLAETRLNFQGHCSFIVKIQENCHGQANNYIQVALFLIFSRSKYLFFLSVTQFKSYCQSQVEMSLLALFFWHILKGRQSE